MPQWADENGICQGCPSGCSSCRSASTFSVGDLVTSDLDRRIDMLGMVYRIEKLGTFRHGSPKAVLRQIRGGRRRLKTTKVIALSWLRPLPPSSPVQPKRTSDSE